MVGGYCNGYLAHMRPYALNLETQQWTRASLQPDATTLLRMALLSDQSGPDWKLPEPRQRMGAFRLSREWLLICGGCPAQVCALSTAAAAHCTGQESQACWASQLLRQQLQYSAHGC